jgi:hypothetical protein
MQPEQRLLLRLSFAALRCSHLNAALDDSVCNGVTGQAGAIVNVELRHEALAVFLHCLGAEVKFFRRLFVRFAFRNELEHFHLSGGQVWPLSRRETVSAVTRIPLMAAKAQGWLRNRGTEKVRPQVDCPDRLRENSTGGLFMEIANRADYHGPLHIRIIAVCGQYEHLGIGSIPENLPGCFESV